MAALRHGQAATRGTVSLVALCFVAVLGVVLGSYLAVCSRAMNLSNRSFQAHLARQLAEFGLEEGLRAFNANNWSDWSNGISADWTVDPADHRARAAITFPADKFGPGATATVKIRVDNYDALTSGVTWNANIPYGLDEVVGLNGTWFRNVQGLNHSNTPNAVPGNLSWWIPAPIPWAWRSQATYTEDSDIVFHNGSWWRCTNTHVSGSTFVGSNWAWTTPPAFSLQNSTYYSENQFVYRSADDTWYRSRRDQWVAGFNASDWEIVSGPATATPSLSWAYRSTIPYSFNDVVYHDETWYRYVHAAPVSGITPGSNPAYWENALTGGASGWTAGARYRIGDTVYHGATNQWYRCIQSHTSGGSIAPPNANYWANSPAYSLDWNATRRYSQHHIVTHSGVWYRSLRDSNVGRNPDTAASYWVGANTVDPNQTWQPDTTYAVGDYRAYGGVWYRCLAAHTGGSPNDTDHWTPTSPNALNVTTGAPVLYAEAEVTIPNQPPIRTQIRATLRRASLVPNAAAGTTDLSIGAGPGLIDSYDHMLGTGYAAQRVVNLDTNYSAVVAAGANLLIAGNTTIRGYLAWPSPPANLSTTATLAGPTSPAAPRIDPTRISRSPVIPAFEIQPAGGLTAAFSQANFAKGTSLPTPSGPSAILDLGTPGAVTPAIYHLNGNLELGDMADHYSTLNVNGPVILYINGDLQLRSGGGIRINSTGSAEIHFAGQLETDNGNTGMINRAPSAADPDPRNLVLLSDNASSSAQSYTSATPFHGIFYLPNTATSAGLTLGEDVEIYGAVSARKLTFTAAPTLHYDVSLRHASIGGVDQPHLLADWRELPVTEQATMP